MARVIVLLSIATLAFTAEVQGLQCYGCTTKNYPDLYSAEPTRTSDNCISTDKSVLSAYTKDCAGGLPWCATSVDLKTSSFARTCLLNLTTFGVSVNSCFNKGGRTVCVCDSDLCNIGSASANITGSFSNAAPMPTPPTESAVAPVVRVSSHAVRGPSHTIALLCISLIIVLQLLRSFSS